MTVGSGLSLNPGETNLYKIVTIARQLIEGRSNSCGTFTLTANSTVTTVTAQPTVGANSVIIPIATTASAAACITTLFQGATSATTSGGQFIMYHANNATTDRIYNYIAIG